MVDSVVPVHGRGRLSRNGRKRGAKAVITRIFEEFARATLEDPAVQAAIRARLMQELAGKKRNPLPTLAVLASAAVKEKPSANRRSVVFVAEVVNGRGSVTRVELDGEAKLSPAELAPTALPSA